MGKTLEEKLAELPEERRERIEAHAQELIAEEKALRALRKLLNLTQVEMADRLNIAQEGVSRLEQRQDLKLSTLQRYIEALGGKLNLVVEFPDRAPVSLSGLIQQNSTHITPDV